MKYVLSLILAVLFLSGCVAIESQLVMSGTERYFDSFDLSKQENTGKLTLQCRPSGTHIAVNQYAITVDNNEPIKVPRYSDIALILDEGEHKLKLYAVSDWSLYGEQFGKEINTTIQIEKDKTTVYEYFGPYMTFTSGRLRRIK